MRAQSAKLGERALGARDGGLAASEAGGAGDEIMEYLMYNKWSLLEASAMSCISLVDREHTTPSRSTNSICEQHSQSK